MHMTGVYTATREAVAAEIRAAAARQRVPGTAIAKALGLSQQALSRRMTGQLAFDTDELEVVGRLLGMDPRDFFPPPGAMPLQGDTATVSDISPQNRRATSPKGRNTVYCSKTRAEDALTSAA